MWLRDSEIGGLFAVDKNSLGQTLADLCHSIPVIASLPTRLAVARHRTGFGGPCQGATLGKPKNAALGRAAAPRRFLPEVQSPPVRNVSGFQMAIPGNSFFATQVITEPGSVTMICTSFPLLSMAKKAPDENPKGSISTVYVPVQSEFTE